MSVQIDQQLGSVEILSLLGRGAMGELYRARDTKLKRDVAIKVLPDEFSRDPKFCRCCYVEDELARSCRFRFSTVDGHRHADED